MEQQQHQNGDRGAGIGIGGGNPLELALLKLAQTMGVAMPATITGKGQREGEGRLETSQEKDAPSEEEGELSMEKEEKTTSIPLVAIRREEREVKRRRKGKPASSLQLQNGDLDAESLLRERWPKKKTQTSNTKKERTPTERPKVPCRYWMEGKCAKGDTCTFSHALKPNKTQQEAKVAEVCRFHMAGNCLKGSQCLYSHDLSQVPCRFFHVRGECAAGSKCRFSHAPIAEQERHLLFAEVVATRDPRLSPSISSGGDVSKAPSLNKTPTTANTIASCKGPSKQEAIFSMKVDSSIVKMYNPFGSPF